MLPAKNLKMDLIESQSPIKQVYMPHRWVSAYIPVKIISDHENIFTLEVTT